jgi:hypothetical protein
VRAFCTLAAGVVVVVVVWVCISQQLHFSYCGQDLLACRFAKILAWWLAQACNMVVLFMYGRMACQG